MNVDDAHGVFLNMFSDSERAVLAAVMGLLTIPAISLVFIDTVIYRTVAALLVFIIAVPTWWFALTTVRNIFQEHGYLRVDRGIMVAAGAIPITATLLYIIGRGAAMSPALSMVISIVLTTVAVVVTYKAVTDVIDGENVHYRLEGDWLAYYSGEDGVQDAYENHEFDRSQNLNFNTLYLMLFIELALLLNIHLTATTVEQKALAFLLSSVSVLVPFLVIVALRIIEYDEYNESSRQLLGRLSVPYIYGFTAVFMFSIIVYGVALPTAAVITGLAFIPFVIFNVILMWLLKPSILANTPIPESPT